MKSVIIDRLIEIEESAVNITREAHDKELNLPVLIQQKCDEIDAMLKEEHEKNAAQIRADAEKETARKVSEIEKDKTSRYGNLDKYYEENHEKWVQDILNAVIGRG